MPKPKVTVNCVASHHTRPNQRIIEFSEGGTGGLISLERMDDGTLLVSVYRLDDDIQVAVGYDSGKRTMVGAYLREISAYELADLAEDWENATVDTRKYIQNVMHAWETDEATYLAYREKGELCMQHNSRYYVA